VLEDLGVSRELLGSRPDVEMRLTTLSKRQVKRIREAIIHSGNVRFRKSLCKEPYGKSGFREKVEAASLEKLSGLIRSCGFLLQTKVYLFYRNPAAGKSLNHPENNEVSAEFKA
jgi:hypothetical protein